MAGLAGAAFDQLTVTISADYFTLGKGLPHDSLRTRAAWLGFRSALPLGALIAGVALLRARSSTGSAWRRQLTTVLAATVLMLPVFVLVMLMLDPFEVRESSVGVLSADACTRYLVAWGLHVGAYVGVSLGVLLVLLVPRGGALQRSDRSGPD